jgi:FKBP-type peptidyl-prolyl cis-trans isomerase 2
MKVGEQKKIYVKASSAYGAKKKSRYISFDRNKMAKIFDLKIGMKLKLNRRRGDPIPVRISNIEDEVILDANHPLAGKGPYF